jgi:exonuclease III
MTQKAFDAFLCLIVGLMMMGWVDWLWLFGVEDSKSYTWWALMYQLGQ